MRVCHKALLKGCRQTLPLSREIDCLRESRFKTCFSDLLESVSQLNELGLAPCFREKRKSDRQVKDAAGGNGDVRIAGNRRRRGAAAIDPVAIYPIGGPGGPGGGPGERVEDVLLGQYVDSFFARQPMIAIQGILVSFI